MYIYIRKSKKFSAGIRRKGWQHSIIFSYTLIPTLNNFDLPVQLKCSSLLIWLELFP